MFGEYAQIASYLTPRDNYGFADDSLPSYLRPPPPHSGQLWETGRDKTGLKEDFIMIAEFSELEGPKPVLTIPKDGGANFDQNSFSVRILATDHQAQNEGFSIAEDAQVVLSDYDTGVFAFVHHFVLYDNTARGFVRPYCIAYITTDQRKLMGYYGDISSQMKKVARLFKYGNLLLFVGDLERHLKDLDHTKGVLLNQVSKARLRDADMRDGFGQEARKNAENELHRALQTIHQSTTEIKDILTILRPLLCDRRLEDRFRLLEERAFQDASSSIQDKLSLQENWFNDLSSFQNVDFQSGSLNESSGSPLSLFRPRNHKPLLVETKKANRFNAALRGLHELCSWGAKEGLRKLRHVQEYFKRDMVILELQKSESQLFRPSSAGVFCGQCITGNFLHGLKKLDDTDNGTLDWISITSLDSLESYRSAEEMSYCQRTSNHSPSSLYTVDSQNGNMFMSVPSSFSNTEISLGDETEFYPRSPDPYDSTMDTLRQTQAGLRPNEDDTPSCEASSEFPSQASTSSTAQNEMEETQNEIEEKSAGTEIEKSSSPVEELTGMKASSTGEGISAIDQEKPSTETGSEEVTINEDKSSTTENETGYEEEEEMKESMSSRRKNESEGENAGTTNIEELPATMNEREKEDSMTSAVNLNKCHVEDSDEEEEPPLVVFKEKIDRPLSVISLGCQEETDEETFDNAEECQGYGGEPSDATLSEKMASEDESLKEETAERDENLDACTCKPSVSSASSSPEKTSLKEQMNSELPVAKACANNHSSSETFSSQLPSATETDKNMTENVLCQKLTVEENLAHKRSSPEGSECYSNPSDTEMKEARMSLAKDFTESNPLPVKSMVSLQKFDSMFSSTSSNAHKVPEENSPILDSPSGSSPLKSSSPAQSNSPKGNHWFPSRNQRRSPGKAVKKMTSSSRHDSESSGMQGASDYDNSDRFRSSSEASSGYLEITMQDLPEKTNPPFPGELQSQNSMYDDDFQLCDTDYPDGSTQAGAAGIWRPRHGLYTLGDWLNNLGTGKPGAGHGLLHIINSYTNLQHVIFSLLSGRPVLVVGTPKMESDVIKIVHALAAFVPSTKRNRHTVLEWMSKPLRISDLTKLRLVGLCRPEKRSLDACVPYSIKKVSSIFDIERRLIIAPHYHGQLINSLLGKRKSFKMETSLLSYIQLWLMDIMSKVFIFFHSFCMGPPGGNLFPIGLKEHRDQYSKTVTTFLAKLGVKDSDCSVVEYIAELVKLSYITESPQLYGLETGYQAQPFQLKHTVCQSFRC